MIYLMTGFADSASERLTSALPEERRAYTLRLPPKKQLASSAAYLLLRYGMEKEWGVPLSASLRVSYGEHGKPYTPDVSGYWNISHTKGMVACVLSQHQCGVDLQFHEKVSPAVVTRVCTPEELRLCEHSPNLFYRFWCCKESYGKYLGLSLGEVLSTNTAAAAENDSITVDGVPIFLKEYPNTTLVVCGGEQEILEVSFAELLEWIA